MRAAFERVDPPVAFKVLDGVLGTAERHPIETARGLLLFEGGAPVAATGAIGAEIGHRCARSKW